MKNHNVTEGDDVHLECVSDGRPAPMVTWSKNGGPSNVTYPPGQRLTIKNTNRTEAGTYTCTAANGIGKRATAARHVNVFCKSINCFVLGSGLATSCIFIFHYLFCYCIFCFSVRQ